MPNIDHFVYFHPNLKEGMAYFKKEFDLHAQVGGQHLGRGTWNAIFALENNAYFEIISPDPKQMPFDKPRWMGLDHFKKPQLIRWAVAVEDLTKSTELANSKDLKLGKIEDGSRQLSNGEILKWQLTAPSMNEQTEPTPFLIEWAGATHPSSGQKPQAVVRKIVLYSPKAKVLEEQLAWLGVDIEFRNNAVPKIDLTLEQGGKIINIS